MKTLCILLFLGLSGTLMAQENKVNLRQDKIAKSQRLSALPVNAVHGREIIGNFTISSYHILSTTTPPKEELNLLIGSLVKFDKTLITGDQINPISFVYLATKKMSRNDFIYTYFGRQTRNPEPDMPDSFLVYETDQGQSLGIAFIDDNHVAFNYQGVLVFAERI